MSNKVIQQATECCDCAYAVEEILMEAYGDGTAKKSGAEYLDDIARVMGVIE
tara:strand:- start:493 stop:648 length:156 start_codon:yes stop_codon:yes gene_type:complete